MVRYASAFVLGIVIEMVKTINSIKVNRKSISKQCRFNPGKKQFYKFVFLNMVCTLKD